MKKWRITYWNNLYRIEWIVNALTKKEAREKFVNLKGEHISIIQISPLD